MRCAVGLRADPLRLLVALGAQLRGLAREVLAHAVEHRLAHLVGQVDALDAHVDQLMPSWFTERPANWRMSPMNSARSAATTCWIVRLAMTPLRPSFTISARRLAADVLVAVRREVVVRDVRDAPLHEEVDVQDLAFARQELLRGVVARQTRRSNFWTFSSHGTMKCRPGSKSVATILLEART